MASVCAAPPPIDPQGLSSVSRRDFVRLCTMAAAAVGLGPIAAARFVEAAEKGLRPSVIWLQFQECTGCTESLLRTAHPAIDSLIFDLISLDYHETLFAAAGHQAEAALKQAIEKNAGKFVLVVEGAIPTKDDGIYCKIGGRTAIDDPAGRGEQGGRDHRDRIVRVVGRHAVRRSEPDRRGRRARRS